jgi:hypothetical protein
VRNSGCTLHCNWYKTFMTYLVESPENADVRALDSAMDGLGADGVALIEFLVGRPQASLTRRVDGVEDDAIEATFRVPSRRLSVRMELDQEVTCASAPRTRAKR